MHHNGSIPTHPGSVGALDGFVARKLRLILWADGVDVVRGWDQWNIQLEFVASTKQRLHDLASTASAVTLSHCVE